MAARKSPFSAFNFLVEINGEDIEAGFSEVTGLGVEITMAEYRDGLEKENHVIKVANVNKVPDVTLKRGVVNSATMWEWINKARQGGVEAQRDVTIILKDEANSDDGIVSKWKLTRAVPIKYTGPSLNAKGGSDVAMEELVLSAENITYG